MADQTRPTVLLVDDDRDVVGTYHRYLEDDYAVLEAYDGTEALSILDDCDVDVVLLDRMMPGLSGGEVLAEIRRRGYDCKVAMVTAVDPDFDIVTMGFDDYVTKPSSQAELHQTVDRLLNLTRYAERIQEYHALLTKRDALVDRKTPGELATNEAFMELEQQIDDVRSAIDDAVVDLRDDATFVAAIRAIDGGDHVDRE